ncbi:XF1762 family protein [Sphaerisporangium sp. B11E5]|uniref:XF1762 family protein n=1 Tax=Sphaerisporangium sp. B11E5 TaxID=3153563 RepID=UPI00325CF4D5
MVPIKLHTARAFIAWTRHAPPPQREATFAIGVNAADGVLIGVAIAGRPMTPELDDGHSIELIQLATDGTPDAAPALVGAAWRITLVLGYRRLIAPTRGTGSER